MEKCRLQVSDRAGAMLDSGRGTPAAGTDEGRPPAADASPTPALVYVLSPTVYTTIYHILTNKIPTWCVLATDTPVDL